MLDPNLDFSKRNVCPKCKTYSAVGTAIVNHYNNCSGPSLEKRVAQLEEKLTPNPFMLNSKYAKSYLTKFKMAHEEAARWASLLLDLIDKEEKISVNIDERKY